MFRWSPIDLGAPTATNKDSLFDWQNENKGGKSIERFGGIDALLKSLGTSKKEVRCVALSFCEVDYLKCALELTLSRD